MMGNEGSKPVGLHVDTKSVDVTEGWSLHNATCDTESISRLSVFICDTSNSPSTRPLLLEQCCKNLLLYRHPHILKYVSSWQSKGVYHLATEEVRPLTQVLSNQSPLEISVGLHSILKALTFLHEKARGSHNNVCRAAVYVTHDGTWKLGGFEYFCLLNNVTPSHLQKTRAHRYEKAVPPEEDTGRIKKPESIDKYAFGVLAEEVLASKSEDDFPGMLEFVDFAKKQLQNPEPSLRPPLSSLLNHPFFTHEFIKIHSFLVELPVKLDVEKQKFFRELYEQLSRLPEELVATQLSGLLLARVVLLDPTAQDHFLPHIFKPRSDTPDENESGLFSVKIYKQHIVPRLIQMFCVRDTQIRLLLLSHFSKYFQTFTVKELKKQILPELLVGIKDTNDHLVSATLKTLADLVPMLGAETIIGGKRARLFADGRPKIMKIRGTKTDISPVNSNGSPVYNVQLTERLSPDGGEAESKTSGEEEEEEGEAWSDWENNGDASNSSKIDDAQSPVSSSATREAPQPLPDIAMLDIKNITSNSVDEFDYFQDMEPVISKPPIAHVPEEATGSMSPVPLSTLFEFKTSDNDQWDMVGDGWGDNLDDWEDDNDDGKPSSAKEDDS